jgi:hypothetical protein
VRKADTNPINVITIYHYYLIYPIRGGAIIGAFMIWALKGAFMGYIGLLLKDPYKRDRIDGWLLDIFLYSRTYVS